MRTSGVVLVGGRSARMGEPKASLEWHGSTLLRRTVGILARCVSGPVLVVRAPGQAVADIPGAAVVEDRLPDRGPLHGLAVGLAAAAADGADAAFVCATDLPFLHPSFVRRILAALDDDRRAETVQPAVDGHPQPLAAAYRTHLADRAAAMLAREAAGPSAFAATCRTRPLDASELLVDPRLRLHDPELASLRNVNDPEAYRRARAEPAPLVDVEVPGAGTARVRAATLAEALAAVGVEAGRTAAVDGGAPTPDGTTPLAAGDRIVVQG